MKSVEYFKPYINIKNPKVAKGIDLMDARHKLSTVKKKEPDSKSVQSLKRIARLKGEKVSSHSIRAKNEIKKAVGKRI